MGKPQAPEVPDPKETAQAQLGTNIGTAVANNSMGLIDQSNPYGSLTYNENGSKEWTDPYTGQTYEVPTYEAVTSYSPEMQRSMDAQLSAKTGLNELAAQQSGFLKDYLGQPADISADRGYYEDALMERMSPYQERDRASLETRLANQGLVPGSEGWNAEMDSFNRSTNDARLGAILQAGDYAGQEIAQKSAARSQPINEIAALLRGGQVATPNFSISQPGGMPNTDVAGLINDNYQQQYNNYANQMAQWNSTVGGLFGLGANILMASDRRLKKDVVKVGERFGLPVYEYRYVWGGPLRKGYMAQDVLKVFPQAVKRFGGWLALDYSKLPEVA